MKTLTERLNMKFGEVEGAHKMRRVNLGFNAKETLKFALSELNCDFSEFDSVDFEHAAKSLRLFCKQANEDTGYTVSVWID